MTIPDVRGKYPFRLGTTSYVLPADILTNVRFLKNKVDVVQLILFEGRESNLPNASARVEIKRIGKDSGLDYIIHFPIDSALGDPDPGNFRRAVEQHRRIAGQFGEIAGAFVSHAKAPIYDTEALNRFDQAFSVLKAEIHPDIPLLVENLDYDLAVTDSLRAKHGLGVCMDTGHLGLINAGIRSFWESYKKDIRVLHLHGFDGERDHLSLCKNRPEENRFWREQLKTFDKTVIVEVFSESETRESLEEIVQWMQSPT